jgi:TetR/AcrR family transcriptional regulator, transcriptional repressor of bet genes
MGRPSNTDERRAQIVRGAMEVVARQGFERASVSQIAKAAGLSPGLVHYHFANKQEVLLALGDALVSHADERLPQGDLEPRAALDAFVDAHLASGPGASRAAVACWVALGAEAVFVPEVRELYQRILGERRARLLELLRAVCRSEGLRTRGLDVVAASVIAAIEGYFQIALAAPELVPEGSAAGAVKRSLGALLAAQPATKSSTRATTTTTTTKGAKR